MYVEDCSNGAVAALSETALQPPVGGAGPVPGAKRKKAGKAKGNQQLAVVAAPRLLNPGPAGAASDSDGEDGAAGMDAVLEVEGSTGAPARIYGGLSGELLLWLLATERGPAEGWYRAIGLTQSDLAQLGRQHAERLIELKLLRLSAELIGDEELFALLRAKVAGLLLAASDSAELTALLRSAEKLPAFYAATHRPAASARQPSAGPDFDSLPEMSLDEALSEARSIVKALERAGALGED